MSEIVKRDTKWWRCNVSECAPFDTKHFLAIPPALSWKEKIENLNKSNGSPIACVRYFNLQCISV